MGTQKSRFTTCWVSSFTILTLVKHGPTTFFIQMPCTLAGRHHFRQAEAGLILLETFCFLSFFARPLLCLLCRGQHLSKQLPPRSHFLMCTPPPPLFSFLRRMEKPTSFLPPFFPPSEISLFWETSTAITSSGTQNLLPTPMGRKYLIGSFPLTFFSMTLTYLLFSIAPLAVAPPLTFPLLPPLSLFLAPGRYFRTWVLITYHFY